MAKQTITAITIGNCGACSDYNAEKGERDQNIMKLRNIKEQCTANTWYENLSGQQVIQDQPQTANCNL